MRRTVGSLVILLVGVIGSTALASSTPITGSWEAIDPGDDSHITLGISAGRTSGGVTPVKLTFSDDFSVTCVNVLGANGGRAVYFGYGTYNASTDHLEWALTRIRCQGGITLELGGGDSDTFDTWPYSPDSDTLDGWGTVWTRTR